MIIPSLKDYVYDYISGELQAGNLKSDTKINEQDICDKLNISRTPVREALIQLAADGLLESTPRRGFRVKKITEKEAADLYDVIGTLDSMAVELSIDKISMEDLHQMESLYLEMEEAISSFNFIKYYKIQKEFHDVYIDKSENSALIDTLNRLRNRFLRQNYNNIPKEELQKVLFETNQEHKYILKLFRTKDVDALRSYIKDVHWSLSYAELDALE